MSGKKRRGNAARKAQYQVRKAGAITAANKKRSQATHVNNVEKQKVKTADTTIVFNQVCEKYNLDSKGKYALKRLIGTINKSRLTAILDKSIVNEKWFIQRVARITPETEPETNAAKLIKSTSLRVFL